MRALVICLFLALELPAQAELIPQRYRAPAMICAISASTGVGFYYARDIVSRIVFGFFSSFTALTCGTHMYLADAQRPQLSAYQALLQEFRIEQGSAEAEDLLRDLQDGVEYRELLQRYVRNPGLRARLLSQMNSDR